jgi:hypothetical protein
MLHLLKLELQPMDLLPQLSVGLKQPITLLLVAALNNLVGLHLTQIGFLLLLQLFLQFLVLVLLLPQLHSTGVLGLLELLQLGLVGVLQLLVGGVVLGFDALQFAQVLVLAEFELVFMLDCHVVEVRLEGVGFLLACTFAVLGLDSVLIDDGL